MGRVFRVAVGGYGRAAKGVVDLPCDDVEVVNGGASRMSVTGALRSTPAFLESRNQVIVVLPKWNGRTEVASGRPLADLVMYEVNANAEVFASVLPSDREQMGFEARAHVCADGVVAHIVVAEKTWVVGPPGMPYDTPRLLMHSLDIADGAITTSDITAGLGAAAPGPASATSVGTFDITASSLWNINSGRAMETMKSAALPDGDILFMLSLPPMLNTGVQCFRVSGGATRTVSGVQEINTYEEEPPVEMGLVPFGASHRTRDLIHLGAGKVLARMERRRRHSLSILPSHIRFLFSPDGGATWELRTPSGFDVPALDERYFGDIIVHKPATEETEATVLITAWSQPDHAYYLYASKDNALTWERKSRIIKSDTFLSITDTEYWTDTPSPGGNYQEIIRGPSYTRPLDVTLPNRFK